MNASTAWGLAGVVVGVLGIGVAVALYFRGHEKPLPLSLGVYYPVVGPRGIPGVEIRYRDRVVPYVSSDAILFWNGGRGTLRGEDIASGDLLRIQLAPGAEILDTRVVASSRDVIKARAWVSPEDSSSVRISFDFLDRGDGMRVFILHTGSPRGARVEGTIKGVPEGVRSLGQSLSLGNPPQQHSGPGAWIFAAGYVTFGLFLAFLPYWGGDEPANLRSITVFTVIGGLFAFFGAYVAWGSWKTRWRYPEALTPNQEES